MGNYSLKNIFLGIGIGLIAASMLNISMGSRELTVEEIKQEAQKHNLIVLTKEEIMDDKPSAPEPTTAPTVTPEPTKAAAPVITPSPTAAPTVQEGKVTITVKGGMSSDDVTDMLEASGLLKDRKAFKKRLGELNMDSKLKIGTFEISKGLSNDEIIRILTR